MPLITAIERDGEALVSNWGDFHLAAMVFASSWDSGRGPFQDNTYLGDRDPKPTLEDGTVLDYPSDPMPISPKLCFELTMYHILAMTPLNDGSYTLRREHKFIDVTDDEVLHLMPGDILRASRA